MPILHSIPHGLDDYWLADESILETRVTNELLVFLSKRFSDEVHQMTQEKAELDKN
jgi:hypothetical protein